MIMPFTLKDRNHRKSSDKNEPSEAILRRVFEIFGDIRCVDIPQLDPAQRARINSYFTFEKLDYDRRQQNADDHGPSTSKVDTCVAKTYSLLKANDFTFDAYVQFVEYISFVKAMDALRNMKLVFVDDNNKAYAANIKVDFDRSKYLSDKNIRRRRIYRERFLREEKIRLDRLKRLEEERQRVEREEKLKNNLHKRYFEKQKKDRFREREEKRKIKQLERKRQVEETEIERRIRHEERKLIVAQRKLESIRLLGCLFKLIAPVVSKQKVLQELINLEEAQKKEQEEKDRLEKMNEECRQQILAEKEYELRTKILKKYQEKNYEREEYRRERLREIVQEKRTALPSFVQNGKRLGLSYETKIYAYDPHGD
uniref:Meiosis-specific nuclear structural protein 1 n=1 Tax=Romanomermis culicivorax TaxID=13658 RepID=A0A915IMP3_ROMCU